MIERSTTKTKRRGRSIIVISGNNNNKKVMFAALAVAMAVALSLAILPTALTTNQAFAKIQEVDTGSENPGGNAAPGQQPKAKGQGQTQKTELQTPSGESLPILELTTRALG